MFDRQGMKPLHTSMIVKRLQLTIPFRDRPRSNFAHQQSERAWLNHHDAIRRSSRMPREWLVRAQRRLSGVIPFFCLPLYRRQTLKEVIPEFYPIGQSGPPTDSSFGSGGIGPLPFVAPCYAFSICREDRVRATETCLLTVQSLNSQMVVSSDLVRLQRRGSGDVFENILGQRWLAWGRTNW